ncbi:hypothetical protein M1C57_24195 (plasmid) [Rhodococcus pyridinivorans]|uniref:hypothetical protein n=1 Tax=Rhodococcus pyridinivorans TaxID=103816 RepID=UPI00200B7E69|nr:hypothetical protein [Rhodococcus pyridinivorans]UPW06990.1 hypothetical protein M1C57_24195 [Rhodococcus pyridinivorans]
MVNKADDSWDGFFHYFNHELGGLKAAEIVERFGGAVELKRVQNWRRRHGRPDLKELPKLSVRWRDANGDPTFFAKKVKAVPDKGIEDAVYLQRRIIELREQLRDYEVKLRLAGPTEATGSIVAEATASEEWAVAVQPAIEGPTGMAMHVADRLDFRRVYRDPANPIDPEQERERLERTLEQVIERYNFRYAPALDSQWSSEMDTQGPPLRYSVRHTTAQFSPERFWEHLSIRAVAVVSLTAGPWTKDVAALVARILGYGFTDTSQMTQMYRPPRAVGEKDTEQQYRTIPTEEEQLAYETTAHKEHLLHPWDRYVWAHIGDDVSPGSFLPETIPSGVHVIWLKETPQLLKNMSEEKCGQWEEMQQSCLEQIERLDKGMNFIHVLECESADRGTAERRTPRWNRTFNLAADIIESLFGRERVRDSLRVGLSQLGTAAQPGPINKCLADWLRENRDWAKG